MRKRQYAEWGWFFAILGFLSTIYYQYFFSVTVASTLGQDISGSTPGIMMANTLAILFAFDKLAWGLSITFFIMSFFKKDDVVDDVDEDVVEDVLRDVIGDAIKKKG